MTRELTKAELQDLKFYRQQVDSAEHAAYQKDARPDSLHRLYHARENLRQFTKKLRDEGCRI